MKPRPGSARISPGRDRFGEPINIVERFIEVSRWPTSRRTVLWASVLLPLYAMCWLLRHAIGGNSGSATEFALFDAILGAWMLALILSAALAAPAAIAGRDARWTAHAFALLFSSPVVVMAFLFDSVDAAVAPLVFVPVVVLFMTVFFDEAVGAAALFYCIAALFLISITEGWLLPSGNAILGQFPADSIALGVSGLSTMLFATFVSILVMCMVLVSARREQEARLLRARTLIGRYVPAQVVDAILGGRSEHADRHERRKLSIFFSDIVGFTDLSEELEPEDLSRLLNDYFSRMTEIAHRHAGTVDELSGDAILVLFGAPAFTDDRDHARRAVRMAIEMQSAIGALNERWRNAGITETLRVRMGINTGTCTVGNFGSPERMKYAALGKHVNLAARIQHQAEPGRIVLSIATWLLVNDEFDCTPKGEMQFKGINKPVAIYEVKSPLGAA